MTQYTPTEFLQFMAIQELLHTWRDRCSFMVLSFWVTPLGEVFASSYAYDPDCSPKCMTKLPSELTQDERTRKLNQLDHEESSGLILPGENRAQDYRINWADLRAIAYWSVKYKRWVPVELEPLLELPYLLP